MAAVLCSAEASLEDTAVNLNVVYGLNGLEGLVRLAVGDVGAGAGRLGARVRGRRVYDHFGDLTELAEVFVFLEDLGVGQAMREAHDKDEVLLDNAHIGQVAPMLNYFHVLLSIQKTCLYHACLALEGPAKTLRHHHV